MMDEDESKAIKLEQRFWSIAQQTAEFHFYELTPQRSSFLRTVIHEGVKRIIAENRMNDEPSIHRAEGNLVKFVTKLAELPEKESTQRALNFGEFKAAGWGLCPCWPFC